MNRTHSEGSGIFSDVVPLLVGILRNSEQADKVRALEALRAIGPDARLAVPVLIEFLDVQYKLQSAAAEALSAIGPAAKDAVAPLANIMLRRCPTYDYAHYSAALALGCIGDETAIPALIEAAQDPDQQGPGWRAIDALAKFGPKAALAAPVLAKLLSGDNVEWKGNTIYALSQIGPADGIAGLAIMDWLKTHPKDEYRASTVEALYHVLFTGGQPPSKAADIFIQTLDDDDEIAEWGAIALGHLRERRAIAVLVRVALSTRAERLRTHAISSLGFIGVGSEEVLASLAQLLLAPQQNIRCFSAFAAGWIGPAAQGLLPLIIERHQSGMLAAPWLDFAEVRHKIEGGDSVAPNQEHA